MAEWFASGRIVDLILILVAVEALLLVGWRVRRGHGPSPASLLANLASGASLMLAVRAALTEAGWGIVAACLLVSLAAHLLDLFLRLRDDHRRSLGRRIDRTATGTSPESDAFTARSQTGIISSKTF